MRSGLPFLHSKLHWLYTHDLYEAESTQIEDKFAEVQELIYTRDTMYTALQAQADVAHTGTSDPNLIESTMEQAGVDEVTNMEQDASKLWFTSLTAGAVVGIDKIIMLIALIVFVSVGGLIYYQRIARYADDIRTYQWAFSLLPKWEGGEIAYTLSHCPFLQTVYAVIMCCCL